MVSPGFQVNLNGKYSINLNMYITSDGEGTLPSIQSQFPPAGFTEVDLIQEKKKKPVAFPALYCWLAA